MDHPSKRRKIEQDDTPLRLTSATLNSMQRSVSPPVAGYSIARAPAKDVLKRNVSNCSTSTGSAFESRVQIEDDLASQATSSTESQGQPGITAAEEAMQEVIPTESPATSTIRSAPAATAHVNDDSETEGEPEDDAIQQSTTEQNTSPFRLTHIAQLDDAANRDTINLHELLGDRSLTSVWLFDYLFNMEFVMSHFSVKSESIPVYVMHGSWKKESACRAHLEEARHAYPNINVRCAYTPDPYGTHHTKMIVLFAKLSGKDLARVVIHTANMIPFDLENMTQGAWISPWLPLEKGKEPPGPFPIGSGRRFKIDMLRYLRQYKDKARELVDHLEEFDFSSIRAAFVASAPSKHSVTDAKPREFTSFGWPGLKQVVRAAMAAKQEVERDDYSVVIQMSSIGSMTENWFRGFKDVLHAGGTYSVGRASTMIIWPTVEEVRTSLNGYESGGSIHLRNLNATAQKQVTWLQNKYFYHWGKTTENQTTASQSTTIVGDAMRSLAAPHIKTYTRFNKKMDRIAWALLTSANMSTKAWGGSKDKDDFVNVASWEVGVMVWPELYQQDKEPVVMMPVFGRDTLDPGVETGTTRVPLRMPYSLPLVKYADQEKYPFKDEPWVVTETYMTPDHHGRRYEHKR